MLVLLGVSCDDCPSDDEPLCISLQLADIDAATTGVALESIAEADTHPECEPADG